MRKGNQGVCVRYTKPHHLRVMGLGTHHEQMLTMFGVRLGKRGLVLQGLRPRRSKRSPLAVRLALHHHAAASLERIRVTDVDAPY